MESETINYNQLNNQLLFTFLWGNLVRLARVLKAGGCVRQWSEEIQQSFFSSRVVEFFFQECRTNFWLYKSERNLPIWTNHGLHTTFVFSTCSRRVRCHTPRLKVLHAADQFLHSVTYIYNSLTNLINVLTIVSSSSPGFILLFLGSQTAPWLAGSSRWQWEWPEFLRGHQRAPC